jgi:hypothetical protein
MLYCNKCKREVVIYGVSYSEGIEDNLNELRDSIEQQGKIILFNPPPIGPYSCPNCFNGLEER